MTQGTANNQNDNIYIFKEEDLEDVRETQWED